MSYSRWWRRNVFVEKMMEISLSIGDGRSQTSSHQSACPTNKISAVILQNRNRVRWAGSWGHRLWQWQLLTENEWLTLNARWFSDCWLNTGSSLDGWTSWGQKQSSAETLVIRFSMRRHTLAAVWAIERVMNSQPVGIGKTTVCSAVLGHST